MKRKAQEDLKEHQIPISFFNTHMVPELNRKLIDFLYATCQSASERMGQLRIKYPNSPIEIEIEAKLGSVIDHHDKQRFLLPILSECVLNDALTDTNFISNMTMRQHSVFNQAFNHYVSEIPKIKYRHQRVVDKFAHDPTYGKVRTTIDQSSNKVVQVNKMVARIVKEKINSVHMLCPQSPFDVRLTVNLEIQVPKDVQQDLSAGLERKKDRLSYSMYPFQLDLTQVKSNTNGVDSTLHELEIEFLDSGEFIGLLKHDKYDKSVLQHVDCLVNTIRHLNHIAKKADHR